MLMQKHWISRDGLLRICTYAALIAAVWSTNFTIVHGYTFAHACTARERPLSFSFTRLRSRGANVLKESIKSFLSFARARAHVCVWVSSVFAIAPRTEKRDDRGKGLIPPSSLSFYYYPPFGRDSGIHLMEKELLKRYLKRRLLPNSCILRRTGC